MSSADSNPPVELPHVDVPFSSEEALRRSEERYRSLIRAIAQIIWNTTAEGELTTEQPGWSAFTGQSFEEYKGWGWLSAIHPDDQAVTAEAWTKALAKCTLYEVEHRLRRHDGEYRYMQVRAVPIVEADGRVREWTGSHTDITDRKQAEAAIRESEERFRTLADNAPMLLWMSDTNAQYEFFNQGWLSFTGRTLEQELGNGWTEGVHPEDLQRCLDLHLGAFQTRQPFEVEYRLRRADGEYRWILDRGAPRVQPNGTFAGFIGSCIDITARKRAEDSLHHRAEELSRTSMRLALTAARLEKRNQELDQFAYVVSHDLKAPLRAIANLSQWLEEDLNDCLTEDTRQQMDLLRGRVHRLEALIDGILQYSRVGRVAVQPETVSVEALLHEVIDTIVPPDFSIEIAAQMPTLKTERVPLEQVFTNLISNAIKHHDRPAGRIQITVTDHGDCYEFAVTDDGPGMAPQFHDKIFGIFQTLEPRDKVESTGVGLAVVKKIVERQGGTIRVESELGQGATFRFTWMKEPSEGSD